MAAIADTLASMWDTIAGWSFALALASAALFIALLNPLSGMLGGALYWLIGCALPTLSVRLLQ